ncbi:sensor histidine kinase [Mycobacterium sp. Aquia_213]|uniref:sensor histidine kinase n=1 Tax=Mycobacterium sp. Aquia_213 TaxID=2991728 RepID=UPI0022702FD8|nr:HAMP domain-containing sensor histidine kinase [Mycobacterium sp. Aquia_213]WAC89217.1 HAMP domain-containing sensor histidine kinase [Mycobacterium sp. Aquia_213]
MEQDSTPPNVRQPWPTTKVFWNLAAAMVGFGILVAVVGRISLLGLGIDAKEAFRPQPVFISITAGILIGVVNYLIVSRVVRHRLHVVSARLMAAQREIADSVGADSWEPLTLRYGLPVYSDDEFGRTAASFNYLLNSLDESQLAERELRQSLVEQAKLAAMGTLTAGVAHETKNPLNFVKNFGELNLELCAELREVSNEDGEELVTDIEDNTTKIVHHAQRALDVMATMLQVGRSHAGDAQPCHLNRIVEQSAGLAEHSWRASHQGARCAIQIGLDDDDPIVRGFEGDLVQVMINLVMNGLEAAGSDPDRVGEVRITVQHDDQWTTVAVTDNGSGVAPDALTRIFEPFFTTKYRMGGTGLGLSISKNIVDNRHNGELSVSNVPGAGARFVVKLPLEALAAKAGAPA